jgi:hypothetical protein
MRSSRVAGCVRLAWQDAFGALRFFPWIASDFVLAMTTAAFRIASLFAPDHRGEALSTLKRLHNGQFSFKRNRAGRCGFSPDCFASLAMFYFSYLCYRNSKSKQLNYFFHIP